MDCTKPSPEQQPSELRQNVEGQIRRRHGRLKWYQRVVGGACLLLGGLAGILDGKAVAEKASRVPLVLGAVPAAAIATLGTHIAKENTRKAADRLINEYASQVCGKHHQDRYFRTEIQTHDNELQTRLVHDDATASGERFDHLFRKPDLPGPRDVAPEVFLFTGANILATLSCWDAFLPTEVVSVGMPMAAAGIIAGATLQLVEEGSLDAHLAGYIAQLDNLESGLSFGALPPPQGA